MDADSSVHAVLRNFRPGSRQLLRERERVSAFALRLLPRGPRATLPSCRSWERRAQRRRNRYQTLPRKEEQLDRFRLEEAGWASLRDVTTVEGRGNLTDDAT